MKVKKVFKYGTGEVIPKGAIYLSTQVEKSICHYGEQSNPEGVAFDTEKNTFVWHYFLVEVEDE